MLSSFYPVPDELLQLGKYLGPAIVVGLTISVDIFKHNGKVVYHVIYWPHTAKEKADKQVHCEKQSFIASTEESSGIKFMQNKLEKICIPDTLDLTDC